MSTKKAAGEILIWLLPFPIVVEAMLVDKLFDILITN